MHYLYFSSTSLLVIFDFHVKTSVHFFQTIKWFMGQYLADTCQFVWSDEFVRERTESSRL